MLFWFAMGRRRLPKRYLLGRTGTTPGHGVRHRPALARLLPTLVPAEDIGAVWSSTKVRAQETAAPIAAAYEHPVRNESCLRELDFGTWEGCAVADIRRQHPQQVAAWFADPVTQRPPEGENFTDMAARLQPWLEQHRAPQQERDYCRSLRESVRIGLAVFGCSVVGC